MRPLPKKATGNQITVLRLIKKCAAGTGKAELSLDDIKKRTGLATKSSAQRALEYLVRKELVTVQAGASYRKSVITINNHATQEKL